MSMKKMKRGILGVVGVLAIVLSLNMAVFAASSGEISYGVYGSTSATINLMTGGRTHATGSAAISGSNVSGVQVSDGLWGYAGTNLEYVSHQLYNSYQMVSYNKIVTTNPTRAYGRLTGGGVYFSSIAYR